MNRPGEMIEAAVSVSTSVSIDWAALGRLVAATSSNEQAEFLEGLRAGFGELGAVASATQMAYIGRALPTRSARWDEVADLLGDLAVAILEQRR